MGKGEGLAMPGAGTGTGRMTPEGFRRVDQLVSLALKRPVSERGGFIREACAGEEDLRIEVQSLLASHENSQNKDALFGEAPARLAAEFLAENPSDLVGASVALPTDELAPGRYKI